MCQSECGCRWSATRRVLLNLCLSRVNALFDGVYATVMPVHLAWDRRRLVALSSTDDFNDDNLHVTTADAIRLAALLSLISAQHHRVAAHGSDVAHASSVRLQTQANSRILFATTYAARTVAGSPVAIRIEVSSIQRRAHSTRPRAQPVRGPCLCPPCLAEQLDPREMKVVNVWYQNKRRSVKKKLVAWTQAENASGSRRRREEPKTHSMVLRNPQFSLEAIASFRERKDSRPPLRPRTHIPNQSETSDDSSDEVTLPENIYELIPSSPLQPPSSPSAECMLLSGLPPRSKTKRSLEWACAKDRADRRQRANMRKRKPEELEYDGDIPELDLDDALGSEVDDDDLITPDTSLQRLSVPTDLLQPRMRVSRTSSAKKRVPRADEEAARALLAFRGDT